MGVSQNLGVIFVRGPTIRIVFLDLFWGSSIHGNYQEVPGQ